MSLGWDLEDSAGVAYGDRLTSLSSRERAVVDLAAEGRTDEQIAQSLGLSVSTINSYWVRIRGKLGLGSRVEIVSDLLRFQAGERLAALRQENLRLREAYERNLREYEALMEARTLVLNEVLSAHALNHLPEAALITEPPANVVFANRKALKLYGARVRGLDGLPMRELTTAATEEALREPCRRLFERDDLESETVGIDEPYYARRRDGSNFRAVLQAQRFESSKGVHAVVVVREFLQEAESILRALREPLRSASG